MFVGQTVFLLLVLQFLLLPNYAKSGYNNRLWFPTCHPEEKCVPLGSCPFLLRKTLQKRMPQDDKNLLRSKQCNYREASSPTQAYFVCCQVLPKSCGQLPLDFRVIGDIAQLNGFPWMAMLLYQHPWDQDRRYTQECAGSLINKRYVVTAAHCINPGSLLLKMVRLGEHNISTAIDCVHNECAPPHLDIPIEEKIIHEGYDRHSLRNDIALLRLKKPVDYSNAIKPICVIPSYDFRNHFFINESMTVAGWGVTQKGRRSDVLRTTTVKGRDSTKCTQTFRESSLCALSTDGSDSTNGDSGGPLMARMGNAINEFVYLAGITSYGSKFFGVVGSSYTRTEYFIDWIKEKLIPSSQDEF
ncbi:spaetzle-processing enzyme-like [Drosophila ficusphila]|uniref:spaetzle-processing enzyme-like n=1 Tax=Drosophila ficusphila TaxID=30025 RepID=UPI0007E6D122|nr:spaetzle-processing enzyme-like [Drosophila ficusphila]